ncbi:insulinase family protein [Candidatus Uhrbacteria bacterium]|nr:insulinase family protein [Candidatus Uhrbacteria bacterium]
MKINKIIFENGFTLIHLPFKGYRTAYFNLMLRVGSFADPKDKEGLSHLVEHVQAEKVLGYLRKTKDGRHIADDFSAVSYDRRIELSSTFHRRSAKTAFFALKEGINGLVDEGLLETERKRVISELGAEMDSPDSRHWHQAKSAAFGLSDDRHLVLGNEKTVSLMTTNDVRRHVDRTYVGQNMVLVVAGDFEFALANSLAKQCFGDLRKGRVAKTKKCRHFAGKLRKPGRDIRRTTFSWLAPFHDVKQNLKLSAVLNGLQERLKESVADPLGIYYLSVDMIVYDRFVWVTIHAEVSSDVLKKYLSLCKKKIEGYADGLTAEDYMVQSEALATDLDMIQDFPKDAGREVLWNYLMFGDLFDPGKLSELCKETNDFNESKRMFRRIVCREPFIVIT